MRKQNNHSFLSPSEFYFLQVHPQGVPESINSEHSPLNNNFSSLRLMVIQENNFWLNVCLPVAQIDERIFQATSRLQQKERLLREDYFDRSRPEKHAPYLPE